MNTQRLACLGVNAVAYLSGVYEPANRPRLVPPYRPCGVYGDWYLIGHGQTSLVIKVTPFTVRHLNVLPFLMPYWLTLRLVRFASPRLSAGMVALSPTSSVPIG